MINKIYYDPASKGFYQTDVNDVIPASAVEIPAAERSRLLKGQSEGKQIVVDGVKIELISRINTDIDVAVAERVWRNTELARADIELNRVQDSDPRAAGSVSQWREYRKALRSWPEHKDFPNKESRPVSPLIKE